MIKADPFRLGDTLTYPLDPTGPSLDRAGDYDPDWDLPSNDEPDLNRWDASDIVGVIMWALAIVVIGWALLFSPASAEAHVPGADLGPSQGAWLTDPYSPLPAQTLEAVLDAVSGTKRADIYRTLDAFRLRLYTAAMESIENWHRIDEILAANGLDNPCWTLEVAQEVRWYDLAQTYHYEFVPLYHNPPRGLFKHRLTMILRDLVEFEQDYRACWEMNRPHEGDLR